jgi:hypothetical protein
MRWSPWQLALAALLCVACGVPAAQPPPSTDTASATAVAMPTAAPAPATVSFAEAQSVGLATSEDGALLVVLGMQEALFVARSENRGQSFSPPVKVSGEVQALVSRLERPALATGGGGQAVVSWLEPTATHGATIWYSHSEDNGRSFSEPILAGRSEAHETTMVRAALAENGAFLSWLQDGALQLVHGEGAAATEALVVDPTVCDCCQPALLVGEQLFVAYRNVEQLNGRTARDLYVAASADGGVSFAEPVRVSDTPWYLDACPISGPAIASDTEHIYVAWMDGRSDDTSAGARADIWLARSDDGGRSFGANVRVNPDETGYHNLPTLAIDRSGRLHIAWEAQEDAEASILYSTSDDGGRSFAAPRRVVLESGNGRPSNATLAATADGLIALAWVDRAGAHVLTGL